MALKIRKRGRFYHVRGTVRVGSERRRVQEHTTGSDSKGEAEAYKARLECDIRAELLDGRKVGLKRLTFADAGLVYINRPSVHPNDVWRIGELNEHMGDFAVADAKEGWRVFMDKRCTPKGLKPATIERFRKPAQAALNLLGKEHGFDVPKLPALTVKNERMRFLTNEDQETLLLSYTLHVQPIPLFLCFEGVRTQEALQLQWPNVNMSRNTVFFNRTKNGEPRTVPLHPRVRAALETIAADRGTEGHVFLNRFGEPYADTRDYEFQGGNPIAKAHRTAWKRAKVMAQGNGTDFTPHDWRHHWASWHVMGGTDLETLRRMGGWKSLEMVQRYAAVSDDHMQKAIKNIA